MEFSDSEYFLGYGDFVDIVWGHHKIGLFFGGPFLCILGSFLKVEVQNRVKDIFWVAKISIFLSVLEIPDIFGGEW